MFATTFALALAAAQPAPPADGSRTDSAAVLALFESICLSGAQAPAGFEPVAWSDFPDALRFMNSYGHGGTFLRSAAPTLTYIAQTRGPGHMSPGIETRCGVAVRGVDIAPIVARLRAVARARPMEPLEMGGTSTTMLIGDGGAFTVTRAEDEWVIVRSLGMMIALPAGTEGGGRERRRDRRKR